MKAVFCNGGEQFIVLHPFYATVAAAQTDAHFSLHHHRNNKWAGACACSVESTTGAPDDVTHSQVIKRAITSVVVRLSSAVSGNK